MKSNLLSFLYALVTTLSFITCVREIDFSKENAGMDTLVVSGAFTDGPGPHILRLTRPVNVEKQAFEPVAGAEIVLSDDLGNHYDYQEIVPADGSPVFYRLDHLAGVPGRVYTLEIRLPNGEHFRSKPEEMPERIPMDNAEVRGEWFVSTNADGTIVQEPYLYVYAQAIAPAEAKGRYLRWDAEGVYIFNEIAKFYDPFGVQHQCYVPNRFSDQMVTLADLNKYQAGALIREKAGKRRIDFALEHRMGICAYQRTIGREAYEYWQKIKQLVEPTGTILDVPPARAYGNVENITHPDRPALGYFEVAAVDTIRMYTRNGQLGDEFLLPDPQYCDYDWTRFPPVNHPECNNCLLLPGSTLEKPWWWE